MKSKLYSFALILLAAQSLPAWSDCGLAKVVSGDTCSNVKVEMSFAGCEAKIAPQQIKRVTCDGQTIKARYKSSGYKYEATFTKKDDGWGRIQWESTGKLTQTLASAAPVAVAAPAPAAPEAVRAPAAAAPPVIPPEVPVGSSVPQAQNSPIKFSGFFDMRYSTFSAPNDPNVVNAHAQSGFGLEDAALYANYDKDQIAFVMDLAFRRGKNKDIDSAAAAPDSSDSANFGFAIDKSQLYARYKVSDAFVVDFGQFDTLFGVELNDSKDRVFGKTGLVYDATLPVTHTGLMLEYTFAGIYGKIFNANPNNKGSNGVSTSGDESSETGVALGYSNDWIRGQAGYMTRPMTKTDGLSRADRTLLDFTFGLTFGKFTADFEYASVNDPSKNKLTTSPTDQETAGSGYMALLTYKVIEPLSLGVRYEHLSDDPGLASVKKADSYGASVRYKLSPNLELRSEYINYSYEPVSGASYTDHRYNAAALVTF